MRRPQAPRPPWKCPLPAAGPPQAADWGALPRYLLSLERSRQDKQHREKPRTQPLSGEHAGTPFTWPPEDEHTENPLQGLWKMSTLDPPSQGLWNDSRILFASNRGGTCCAVRCSLPGQPCLAMKCAQCVGAVRAPGRHLGGTASVVTREDRPWKRPCSSICKSAASDRAQNSSATWARQGPWQGEQQGMQQGAWQGHGGANCKAVSKVAGWPLPGIPC